MFSKASQADASAADPALAEDPLVAQARTQARRRLVGAVVLLVTGVVAFPLVFDTQPRPVNPELRLAGAVPPAPPAATAQAASRPMAGTPPSTSLPEDAGVESARPASASAAASTPAAKPAASTPAAAPQPKPEPKAEPKPDPSAPRFVVQAGAYTDASSLRTARQKVESLGLKTYTQEIDNAQGKRTRVRVGPFAKREEAEAAARRIQATGLQANVIAL